MAKIVSKTVGNSDTQQSLLYCLGHLGWHNTERIISILCCVSLSPAFLPWKQCHWLGGMPLLLIWPMWCLFGLASLPPECRHFLFTSGIINLPLYKHWCMLFENYQISLNKISHKFLVTTKLFRGWKSLINLSLYKHWCMLFESNVASFRLTRFILPAMLVKVLV